MNTRRSKSRCHSASSNRAPNKTIPSFAVRVGYDVIMPLAAKNNLDELYAKQRLLEDELPRLERERDALNVKTDGNRRYILDLEIRALREESTNLNSSISDILERDLQR
jgi:hypothetical protein